MSRKRAEKKFGESEFKNVVTSRKFPLDAPGLQLSPELDRVTRIIETLSAALGLRDAAFGKVSTATWTHIAEKVSAAGSQGPRQALAGDWISVEMSVGEGFSDASLMAIAALGMTDIARAGYVIGGRIQSADLAKFASRPDIGTITIVDAITSAGAVTSGAESALASASLNAWGLTGAGVKVGVLSDSYNNLGGAAADIASGDLPHTGVTVLRELASGGSDEGRAMLQIVRDIAPDAQLYFATATISPAAFAQAIRDLANAGCKVIVDDVIWPTQLTFTDDVVRAAIDDVTAIGVTYLTSNGNYEYRGIIEEAPVFKLAIDGYPYVDFDESDIDIDRMSLFAFNSGICKLRLTWSSPAYSVTGKMATTDLDIAIYNALNQLVGYSVVKQSNGFDPVELVSFNITAGQTYYIEVLGAAGAVPSYIQVNELSKLAGFGGPGIDFYSSVMGNALAAGAISVGAVDYRNSPITGGNGTIEAFSSYGFGVQTHDRSGNAVNPTIRLGAEVAGVDGLNTTFFGQDTDGDTRPNFFGTSAAAPSVAGVVALLKQLRPDLTPAQILNILQTTAVDVGVAGFDLVSGSGLVSATNAVLAADPVAPSVSTFSPADGATSVGIASNIVLTFGEVITRGTGTIEIRSGSATGTLLESFNAASSTRLTLSGNQLTIDPISNLSGSTQYFVVLPSGSVLDLAGNSYAGTSTYDFTTAAAPPPNIINIGSVAGKNLNLINPITLDDGSIYYFLDANGDAKNSYVSGQTNTYYLDSISHDFLDQLLNDGFDTIDTQPSGVAYGIDDARTRIIGTSYGNITIGLPSRDEWAIKFASPFNFSYKGTQYSGTPSNFFGIVDWNGANPYWLSTIVSPEKHYYGGIGGSTGTNNILVDSFSDGFAVFQVILDTRSPTALTYIPADGATGVGVASNIVLTFDEAIARGTGTIEIRSGSATGTLLESFNAASSARLTLSGNQLTIDPTSNLSSSTQYFVVLPSGSVLDLAGNSYPGTSTYAFTTGSTPPTNGDDLVTGTSEPDRLEGLEGNDRLDGLAGADTLIGGLGDDCYVVDTQGDLVFELPGEGIDTVEATVSFYLYANIENLQLRGSAYFGVGNYLDNTLTGNELENLLIGWDGRDVLNGGEARDALFGVDGNDTLNGQAGIDYLVAGLGDDLIDGGSDADEAYGQAGNDAIYGGNDFATDILVGGEGNDTIDGGPAWDLMYGGPGNDVFFVSQQVDWVFEQPAEGYDIVYADSPNGYYLYANIEDLYLLNTTPFGVGNELDNRLVGNAIGNTLLGGAGNDTLDGKAGTDILWGQEGIDVFVLSAGTGIDIIADFSAAEDKLDLSAWKFANWAAVRSAMTQIGPDTRLDLAATPVQFVIVLGVNKSEITDVSLIL